MFTDDDCDDDDDRQQITLLPIMCVCVESCGATQSAIFITTTPTYVYIYSSLFYTHYTIMSYKHVVALRWVRDVWCVSMVLLHNRPASNCRRTQSPTHIHTTTSTHIWPYIWMSWASSTVFESGANPRCVALGYIWGSACRICIYIYIVWCRWRVECMWYLVCDICLMMFVSVLNSFSLSMCQTQRHLYIQI